MRHLSKKRKAIQIMVHAYAHCLYGSNADNTIREATEADQQAAITAVMAAMAAYGILPLIIRLAN